MRTYAHDAGMTVFHVDAYLCKYSWRLPYESKNGNEEEGKQIYRE